MDPTGPGQNFFDLNADIWDDEPKVHPNNEGHKRMGSSPSHFGLPGEVNAVNPDLRKRVQFGRIFGGKPAFGNLGVQDFVYFDFDQVQFLPPKKWSLKVRVWRNTGAGGTKLLADGNKYCNMVGSEDGRMDYVWTWSTGKMYRDLSNAGKTYIAQGESYWSKSPGYIWTPPSDMDRRDLHLTDWDGDGDCDIVWVNPDNGNLRIWINGYPTKRSWDGAFREISASAVTCDQKRGIGIHDLATNGLTTGYVQRDDGTMEHIPQIKFAEAEKDRANYRWADVNGDGRDDLVWIKKLTGNGYVWYNEGRSTDTAGDLGSSFHWRKVGDPVCGGDAHHSYYNALTEAVTFGQYNNIAEAFGSLKQKEPDTAIINITTDIVTLGFGLIAAPTWNLFVLNRIGNTAIGNAAKDSLNDFVYNGATFAKDYIASTVKPSDPESLKLETAFKYMAAAWQDAIIKSTEKLFDGSPSSIEQITNFIADGRMLERATIVGVFSPMLRDRFNTVLNSFAIPMAWQLSSDKLFPVIIREENFDCDTQSAGPLAHRQRLGAYCYKFPLAPGYKSLRNGSYRATLDDVTQGSLRTWEANGRKNGNS
ncbi:hypothetical protein C8A00DRAFT_31562 [Chaetomidium leptoderma]|uniref:VCBS repeat-containing protein n=1 Tax=Chaetomidium leptoderma TaxID=669021 RepID=A0AAN6VPW1_9PEZI|nr:hypothetical protein C8A00DRAFT_31562 [Chaetomidium leptoderma]